MSAVEQVLLEATDQVSGEARVGLEEYYSEAGPDYAAWSANFNMHFGFYRWGLNPFQRERMLEEMNLQVLAHLRVPREGESRIVDLGCGLGATMRTLAEERPAAHMTGITRVPWQVEQARIRNEATRNADRLRVIQADYERTPLQTQSFDAAYALESACHAHSANKAALLAEAHRLLRPGGRLVLVDGFLRGQGRMLRAQHRIYNKLCECWVIESLGELQAVTAEMERLGFCDVHVQQTQLRVAPSVAHVPWVTLRFLLSNVLLGRAKMTRARWNNVLAPVLLPLVSMPLGPMVYCMVSATRR